MIEHRPFRTLGAAHHGWLATKHHFSFADYHDPARMGWGSIRVWNDDEIAAGSGFPAHPHRDMEIITYVTQGAITHEDSLGNRGRTSAGELQVMSAGSGLRHSEYNRESGTARLFQIWIMPDDRGGSPLWGAKPFPKEDRAGRFVALASGSGRDSNALPIRADARVLGATLKAGDAATHTMEQSRHAYLVPARGCVSVNGVTLEERDGAAITGETELRVVALSDAELVLVETA